MCVCVCVSIDEPWESDLKELELRTKSQEMLKQEQTAAVLQEELELSRR